MKYKIVGDSYFDSISEYVKDEIFKISSLNKDFLTSKSMWGIYFQHYIILSFGGDKIPPLEINDYYTSRYYWLKRFYHFYSMELGKDAGIDQQIGDFLGEMSVNTMDYDWSELKKIDEYAKKEARRL